jgi:hypothetical protein
VDLHQEGPNRQRGVQPHESQRKEREGVASDQRRELGKRDLSVQLVRHHEPQQNGHPRGHTKHHEGRQNLVEDGHLAARPFRKFLRN